MLNKSLLASSISLLLASGSVFATNGYAPHGVGMKSKGMGGVGIALAQDSMVGGVNPAGMVHAGSRLDIGAEIFRPIRSASVSGNLGGADGFYDSSAKKNFLIPEFGYNHMLNDRMSVGVTVFGNGGMNTDFVSLMPLLSSPLGPNPTKSGIDLMQVFIVPSFSMKLNDKHSIGIGLNIAYQQFKAKGLENFAAPAGTPQQTSAFPGNVTGQGRDDASGVGVRIGWMGNLSDKFTVGAYYSSKTNMSRFKDYKGLFADEGSFDVPENYGIGVSFKANPKLTIAADIQQVNYSGVDSIANPLSNLFAGNLLGTENGPGFGWEDQTIFKIGMSYAYSKDLTLRAGYNHGDAPINSSETLFNMLAPATVEDHITLGATWAVSDNSELTFTYMHAFENEINGSGSIPPNFGGGEASIKMYQDSFGIAYGMKL